MSARDDWHAARVATGKVLDRRLHRRCACVHNCGDVPETQDHPYAVCAGLKGATRNEAQPLPTPMLHATSPFGGTGNCDGNARELAETWTPVELADLARAEVQAAADLARRNDPTEYGRDAENEEDFDV